MPAKHDNIYFLHIPKTGGNFLLQNVFFKVRDKLEKVDVSIGYIPLKQKHLLDPANQVPFGHHAWSRDRIAEDTYIVTSLRDPAKRTVSHFTHMATWIEKQDITIENLEKWVEEYKSGIENFQCKNIIFEDTEDEIFLYDPKFRNLNVTQEKVNKNISRINLIIKNNENFTPSNAISIQNKMLQDFGVTDLNETIVYNHNTNINKKSKDLFSQLDKKYIDYLYEINKLDSELFFRDDIYFNLDS